MTLIPDWRQCWRWTSMHAMAGAIVVQGAWQVLDSDMRASIPAALVRGLTVGLLVLGIVGRLVDQTKKCDPTDSAGA